MLLLVPPVTNVLPITGRNRFSSHLSQSEQTINTVSLYDQSPKQTRFRPSKCQTHGLWQFLLPIPPNTSIHPNSKPIVTSIFYQSNPPQPDQIHPQTPIQSLHDIQPAPFTAPPIFNPYPHLRTLIPTPTKSKPRTTPIPTRLLTAKSARYPLFYLFIFTFVKLSLTRTI